MKVIGECPSEINRLMDNKIKWKTVKSSFKPFNYRDSKNLKSSALKQQHDLCFADW